MQWKAEKCVLNGKNTPPPRVLQPQEINMPTTVRPYKKTLSPRQDCGPN